MVRFDLPRWATSPASGPCTCSATSGPTPLSLARLGATDDRPRLLAGLAGRGPVLAEQAGADITFVEAEVYDALELLEPASFDLVYTGIGALCWLPDIHRWAGVVAALLRPGGRLFLREAHPVLWSLEDARPDGLLAVEHPYFEREEPNGGTRAAPTSTPTSCSRTPGRTSGTTVSVRS